MKAASKVTDGMVNCVGQTGGIISGESLKRGSKARKNRRKTQRTGSKGEIR